MNMIEGHDYTICSNGPGGRSRMYALLALITAFLTPLAQQGFLFLLRRYWGDAWDITQVALFFGGFTALVVFGMLISLFDQYLWRTRLGELMFQLSGLAAPPHLAGEYHGSIEQQTATDPEAVFRTGYQLRIAQTWELISILVERGSEASGHVRVHSDMASIRVGMMSGIVTLRFVYTFEESLPRQQGTGTMTRQFSGAATLGFRRDGEVWAVTGHFFDDIGRSGLIELRQVLPGAGSHTDPQAPIANTKQRPAEPSAAADLAGDVASPDS